MIELSAQKGRVLLRLRVLTMGHDIVLLLDGGDTPHIGAVALAGPNTPAQSLLLPHHREDILARHLADTLSQYLNQDLNQGLSRAVSVLCGIHIDAITKDEIADVYALADTLVAEFMETRAASLQFFMDVGLERGLGKVRKT